MRGGVFTQILITVCLIAAVCSTFFQYTIYDTSFLLYPLSYAILVVSVCSLGLCAICRETKFHFSIADLFISLFVFYYLLRYDYDLQLANWKIAIAIQLLIFWFAIRLLFNTTILPHSLLTWLFISLGCIQTIWGFLQLYGICTSNHSLFPITGSFNNPGPYSGYVSIMIPIAASQYFTTKGIQQYLALGAFLLMISILPAGMSRSAWIGAIFSVIWVISMQNNWISKIRNYRKKNHLFFTAGVIFLTTTLFALFIALYILKKDSAYGRLFIWKNTICAIIEQPLQGYGPGMFPSVYDKAQSDFFSNGEYSALEEWVAGSPEYAFNEYLQILVEGGIFLFCLFGLFIGYALWKGVRQKKYGFCGGVVALLLFCCFSYPLQLPSFLVTGTLLLAACVSGQSTNVSQNRVCSVFMTVTLVIASVYLCCHLRPNSFVADIWKKCRFLKVAGMTESAEEGYENIYASLKHNPFFLFEYAQILTKQSKYNEAITVLKQVAKVKCDPMIYNMMGENYQNMKLYNKAEKCYLHSINLLPGRIYPYYLLTILYSKPGFRQPEKMYKMRKIVMTKKPKVDSKAVEEMKEKVKNLFIK